MFAKLKKFPVYWSSDIPISYKQMLFPVNYIEPEKIVTDFDKELRRMKTKFYWLVIRLSSSMILFADSRKKKKNC